MNKGKNTPLIITALICIISITVMTIALMRSAEKTTFQQFIPPPFESAAVEGIPDVPESLGWGKVDAQVYTASVCGVVVPNGNVADVWFTNPTSNRVWLKLRVVDGKGNTIGETGIIKPGEYVQTITFTDVPQVGDTIGLKIMGYEPETYYSAGSVVLTTKITGGSE